MNQGPSMLPPMPVIVGPTAGGKTALAVAIAQRLIDKKSGGEVVSADSMLIYRGMDIGTAKPTAEEQAGVPHHLIDIVEPSDSFSVDQWLARAEACITDIRARGLVPIVVGGTHLYAKALLEGLFDAPKPDPAIREQLSAMDPAARRAELERVDPQAAQRIHPNDTRRTIRALEVFRQTGKPISEHQGQWDAGKVRPDALLVGLEWPISVINQRINARVKRMARAGLIDEVRALLDANRLGPQAREAVGYKQLIDFVDGKTAEEDALERIKIETRRLAKNQRTWLRRLRTVPNSIWIPMEGKAPEEAAQIVINKMFTSE
ncbi:MAG: tRNA (adenosine(37)-N6)-dimethylallyltransferase MiaA [Phycisphaerales bacterium]|nr:tRNA (adenosine(37)-N6)-dimethylallyltransferase MiaA [Phycisphaerales bacterium]